MIAALLLAGALLAPAEAKSLLEEAEGASASEGAAEEATAPVRLAHLQASLALRVDDRAAALDATVAAAQARGGWFSSLGSDHVTVRVPAEDVEPLLEELRGLGKVAERSFSSEDLTAQHTELVTRLESREAALSQYLSVLEGANAKAVVTVEREITRLISDIEQLKGRLQVVEDQGAHGQISVSFTYRDRKAPSRDGTSSFAWINTVNMADLLWDVQHGQRASRALLVPEAPEGFAPWRKRGRFQAVSPEDVVLRVRSERVPRKTRADDAFWIEALRTRMLEAGYALDGEETLETASGHSLHLLELSAANGPVDQAYLVGITVRGPRIVIAEATGEVADFAEHRQAILESLRTM